MIKAILKPKAVEVYISKDLKKWTHPKTVMVLPDDSWGKNMVWAPEMHKYKDKYYLFVTLTSYEHLKNLKKPAGADSWPEFYKRGTQIFYSDNPLGPYKPFNNKAHTPAGMMALDGTFWVENNIPYLIFCNEWVQVVDGTMLLMRLKDDLSETLGDPYLLFKASEAPWVDEKNRKVTDGPYIYKSKTNKLIMIWSSLGKGRYMVGQARSESGNVKGPWIQSKRLVFSKNGGHGMIFRTFDGILTLALHQPNNPEGAERLKLFRIKDKGDHIKICLKL